ncbi:hypothetical protein BaRGS_00004025 [Batillaria attramentaria]|uniref:Uncharacterized protein n=1 Tax=Batillaria attramentaria TaxID=370345 RepID=A0ABD0M024_9CAEN
MTTGDACSSLAILSSSFSSPGSSAGARSRRYWHQIHVVCVVYVTGSMSGGDAGLLSQLVAGISECFIYLSHPVPFMYLALQPKYSLPNDPVTLLLAISGGTVC